MKKFTSLVLFACVLLFLMAVSTAEESVHKRTNTCSQSYKRNVLGKRTYEKKCPCALASTIFDDKVKGLIVYSQDECGSVTVTGFIGQGLDDPSGNYTFQIVDDCGRVKRDLGSLGAVFENNGAKPFTQKFHDFNLNCDKEGVLLSKPTYNKRTCGTNSKYYKRQGDGGTYTRILSNNGADYGEASINLI